MSHSFKQFKLSSLLKSQSHFKSVIFMLFLFFFAKISTSIKFKAQSSFISTKSVISVL